MSTVKAVLTMDTEKPLAAAQRFRQPVPAFDFTRGHSGQLGFLELLPGGCRLCAFGFAQGIEDLRFADAAELVVSCRREADKSAPSLRCGLK